MGKRSSPVLIGDLLTKSELVTLGQLADAMPISLKTGLPVGRVLVGAGFLTEVEFKGAVTAQSLVRENLLPMELACEGLRNARQRKISLEDSLKSLGWRSEYYETTNRLGELLVEAGCIDQKGLDDALDACFTSGMPLGRVLVLRGNVNEMLTYAALTAQILIREGHITRQQALDGLKLVAARKITMEESLTQGGLSPRRGHTIRLGELLMLAELVSEIDLLSAVERGMLDEMPIGQVLVRVGLITEQTLDQSLRLQELVTKGKLQPLAASDILKKVRATGLSLEAALAQYGGSSAPVDGKDMMELPEMLRMIGLIANQDMVKAIDQSSASGIPIEVVLLNESLIDLATMDSAMRCHKLMKEGELTKEQAIFAMQTWLGARQDINEVLAKVGWKGKTPH